MVMPLYWPCDMPFWVGAEACAYEVPENWVTPVVLPNWPRFSAMGWVPKPKFSPRLTVAALPGVSAAGGTGLVIPAGLAVAAGVPVAGAMVAIVPAVAPVPELKVTIMGPVVCG